jgi:RimJ/RimL family protein N-acetyltransferase
MMQLRPATPEDLEHLRRLVRHPAIEPFLAPRAGERLGEMFAQRAELGEPLGLYVIEADGRLAGGVALELGSAHSRLCNLRQLMIDPAARESGIGTATVRLVCHRALVDHGYHRVQTESFGDNHAVHRVFERVGFVREGVRRLAYLRDGEWVDGVLHGLLAGELK